MDLIGLLCKNGKVQVPQKTNLQQKIFMKNHDNPLGGYYGLAKTIKLFLYKYYWLKLRQKIKKYISHYKKC